MKSKEPKICYYCGMPVDGGLGVTSVHIGGQGDVGFPVCQDTKECLKRVEKIKFRCAYCKDQFDQLIDLVKHNVEKHKTVTDKMIGEAIR